MLINLRHCPPRPPADQSQPSDIVYVMGAYRERRMAEEMAGGGGTDSGAPVRPSRRVVADEAGPVRVPAEQPVYARERRSSRDVRRDEPGAGDVRASSSSAIQVL